MTADNGSTSLLIAGKNGHLAVVRELLARGASIEAADDNGATSLIVSSLFARVEVVRTLLAAGADKHHANRIGQASDLACRHTAAPPGSRAAILALLAA